ncbi:MAG TPA: hypothetical protein VMS17_06145 [Gemmataceae bacterium]|nr:hypothetical protein [Gemmataceae bacterium]
MRRISGPMTALLLGASALAAAPDGAAPAGDTVGVKTVKYDGLVHTVHDLQGKVVVVDFWMTT